MTYSISKNQTLAYTIQSSTIRNILLLLLGSILFTGCVVNSGSFEPEISYFPNSTTTRKLPSAFPCLTAEEKETEWGKELYLGLSFAREYDLYRAITCYKRALFLSPCERKYEITYHIIEAYYLGNKFQDVIEVYEDSDLDQVPLEFPALKELLLMLYDSYQTLGMCEKAERIQCLIQKLKPETAEKIETYELILDANFPALNDLNATNEDCALDLFLNAYYTDLKSPRQAQLLNAFFPGAGYYYLGQTKTAVTAFVINALFTWAAVRFFQEGYTAAGVITTSLEMGWYLGGINGAGIAAREWNEHVYEVHAKNYLISNRIFPILQFEYVF